MKHSRGRADLSLRPRVRFAQDGELGMARGLGRNFRLLWTAASISVLGDGMYNAALPLLAASVSATAVGVSLVRVAGYLPWLLFALIGGALVDRYNRQALMWWTNIAQFVVVGAFAALLLIRTPPLLVVAALALLLGCADTIFMTASVSVLPTVVAPEQLEQANGRMQSSQIVNLQFLGPLVGAAIFAVVPGIPFAIDAVSFLAAAVLIRLMGGRDRPPATQHQNLMTSMREGLRWLWNNKGVRLLAFEFGLASFSLQLANTMLVLLVVKALHQSQFVFGVILAVGAAGGLLASFTARKLRTLIGMKWQIAVAIGALGVSLVIAGASNSVILVGAMYTVGSYGVVTWTVQSTTLRQRLVPDALMGRVSSAYRLIGWGSIPVGTALSGALGTAFGVRVPIFVGGAIMLTSLVIIPKLSVAAAIGNTTIAPDNPRMTSTDSLGE